MTIVYRIECKVCSDGPYNCKCAAWQSERMPLQDRHSTDYFLSNHPGMYIDFPRTALRSSMDQFHCGFKDEAQMFNWFSVQEIKLFNANGFVLAICETSHCLDGYSRAQIFFRREKVLRVMEIPTCPTLTR